jgi:hypothetical protein
VPLSSTSTHGARSFYERRIPSQINAGMASASHTIRIIL